MTVELGTLMLAEFAKAHNDGSFDIIGGGLRTIEAPTLPYTHPHLSVVVEFRFSADLAGQHLPCKITFQGPDGESFEKPVFVVLTPTIQALTPEGMLGIPFVYNLHDIVLNGEGIHTIKVEAGDSVSSIAFSITDKTHELPVLGARVGTATDKALEGGYVAFQRGNTDEAAAIFEGVLAEVPDDPSAHNNLGFVSLERGRVTRALSEFAEAERLGFVFPELLNVNIGCALYVLGYYSDALSTFKASFRANFTAPVATLFGIDGDDLFPVQLGSASDYAWLVALNAAEAALKTHALDAAERYARMAEAREDVGEQRDPRFHTALHHLRSMLEAG
jgi:hypothetical protein